MSKAQRQCQIQISMSASWGVTGSQLHKEANTLPLHRRTSGSPFRCFLGPDVNTRSSPNSILLLQSWSAPTSFFPQLSPSAPKIMMDNVFM